MKKYLPKSFKNPAGFTLVELLVVIAIIAILSVIGMAIYSGLQSKSRDARRQADISSVANAMEANYGKTTQGQYDSLAASMFSSGAIPQDPINTSSAITDNACKTVCRYCVKQGAAAQTSGACANITTPLAVGAPAGGASNSYWMVCANLEAGSFYCRGNAQ